MLKESDIVFEIGQYWVARDKQEKAYIVYKLGVTHSKADSAYPLTDDGLSLALYRAKYQANRNA